MLLPFKFSDHYRKQGMTYLQHFSHALSLALICFWAWVKLVIHAFLPCFFQDVVFYTNERLLKEKEEV